MLVVSGRGRRRESMLSSGYSAKIIWVLLSRPTYRYNLAKILQGVEKNPETAKIYTNIKVMRKQGFILLGNDGKYYVNIKKLVAELERVKLSKQNIALDNWSRSILESLVDSFMCRALFQHDADHRYLYRISHDKALFLDYFASFLASYAASSLGNKKYNECGNDLVATLNDDKRELLLSSNISFTEEDLYRMWIYRFDSLAMDFDF